MKNLRFSARTVPLALLALCLIAFGLLFARLGFYWDDWPSIWFLHFFGPSSFKDGFAIDRPLLAYVFMLTTPLVGEATWSWQLFGVLTRWLSSLILWWTLRGLWPRRSLQVAGVVFLFAIYPGFTQQFISVTYSNAFLVFGVFLFSLGAMVWAFRTPRWFWPLLALSVVSAAFCLFTAEYFFGLEFLRPVLLWLLLEDRGLTKRERARKVGLYWSPYVVLLVVFLVWRLFIHESPRGTLIIFDQLRASPLATLLNLPLMILKDLLEVSVVAWLKTLDPRPLIDLFDLNPLIMVGYALVTIVAAGLTIFFLARLDGSGDQSREARDRTWGWQAVLIGLFALLIGGWPFWVTDLHLELMFPWDRFTLPMILGACLLFVGMISLLARTRMQYAIIVGVVVGLAVGMHFQLSWSYRQDWLAQKDFFWQLSWRAPGIIPGTTLFTSELPFVYYSDNSLTAPLNWLYAPQLEGRKMPYMMHTVEARLGSEVLPSLEEGTPIEHPYRVTDFSGSTSQALVVLYDPPRCLKVMDPVADLNLPYKLRHIPDVLPLSRPDLILVDPEKPALPPEEIFGPQPEPDWCYYFQRAELARQQQDWQLVAALGDQALQLGRAFDRGTASELAPFIDGYARVGRWEEALQLSMQAYQASPKMQNMLCSTWYYILEGTSPDVDQLAAVATIDGELECNFP